MSYLIVILITLAVGRISCNFDLQLQSLAMQYLTKYRFYLTQRNVSIAVDVVLIGLAILCLLVG
jgi:hypothetical protein